MVGHTDNWPIHRAIPGQFPAFRGAGANRRGPGRPALGDSSRIIAEGRGQADPLNRTPRRRSVRKTGVSRSSCIVRGDWMSAVLAFLVALGPDVCRHSAARRACVVIWPVPRSAGGLGRPARHHRLDDCPYGRGSTSSLDWRRRRRERALAGVAAGAPDPAGIASAEGAAALRDKLTTALTLLKSARGAKGYLLRAALVRDHRPPGAGKTTALLNAGLRFPLAAGMGQGRWRKSAGTRLCEWWFAEDAVLIDTAGRLHDPGFRRRGGPGRVRSLSRSLEAHAGAPAAERRSSSRSR